MRLEETALCSKCSSGRPVFRREYSGEQLCKACFIESVERKVRRTAVKYSMFDRGDTIAVALSGGKDSVTLLHILSKIERRFPSSRIVALTIDEGIKGYREESVKISRAYCRELGIEQSVSSFREMYGYDLDDMVKTAEKKNHLSPCALCGMLRRRALNVLARERGASKLATAHNLDDETQTILLNMINGDVERLVRTKPKLDGIHSKFVQRVKPLYEIPEREIVLYAYLTGLRFQEAVCPYRETSMRQEARGMLGTLESKHPGIKYSLVRSFERLRSKLREEPNIVIHECMKCGEPSSQILCKTCIEFSELETPLIRRDAYIEF
jgi:uncharacterized protein (TIGR00269 family)